MISVPFCLKVFCIVSFIGRIKGCSNFFLGNKIFLFRFNVCIWCDIVSRGIILHGFFCKARLVVYTIAAIGFKRNSSTSLQRGTAFLLGCLLNSLLLMPATFFQRSNKRPEFFFRFLVDGNKGAKGRINRGLVRHRFLHRLFGIRCFRNNRFLGCFLCIERIQKLGIGSTEKGFRIDSGFAYITCFINRRRTHFVLQNSLNTPIDDFVKRECLSGKIEREEAHNGGGIHGVAIMGNIGCPGLPKAHIVREHPLKLGKLGTNLLHSLGRIEQLYIENPGLQVFIMTFKPQTKSLQGFFKLPMLREQNSKRKKKTRIWFKRQDFLIPLYFLFHEPAPKICVCDNQGQQS